MAAIKKNLCHCGLTGRDYRSCCGLYHTGVKLTDKSPLEVLMTRYSAFCESNGEYLLKTWHPDFRPDTTAKKFSREIKNGGKWVKLKVYGVLVNPERTEAMIRYEVSYRDSTGIVRSMCVSEFVFEDGRWFYTDEAENTDMSTPPPELDSADTVRAELDMITGGSKQ